MLLHNEIKSKPNTLCYSVAQAKAKKKRRKKNIIPEKQFIAHTRERHTTSKRLVGTFYCEF